MVDGEPKISVLYDGAYSDRLNWRTDDLAKFADLTDLRTYVYVLTGDEVERPQISVLGETLAWRNILTMANPFNSPENVSKTSQVFQGRNMDGQLSANIVVNHQILLERVKEQNNGRIDAGSYAKLIDREVARGLRQVLWREKYSMFRYTGGIMAPYLLTLAATPVALLGQAEMFDLVQQSPRADDATRSLFGVLSGLSRFCAIGLELGITAATIERYREFNEAIKEESGQYIASTADMNPVKYPANFLRGAIFLRGNTLVELDGAK